MEKIIKIYEQIDDKTIDEIIGLWQLGQPSPWAIYFNLRGLGYTRKRAFAMTIYLRDYAPKGE